MQVRFKAVLAATAMFAGVMSIGEAQATTTMLNFNGVVANGSFTGNSTTAQSYSLDLGSVTPFTVDVGDEIQVTIGLDSLLTVPGGPLQFVGVTFNGSPVENNPAVDGSFTFSGGTGISSSPLGANCGNCLTNLYSQGGGAYSFTGLYADTFIDALDAGPYSVDDVQLNYYVYPPASAVPEPATWAMLLLGFGAIGWTLRQRRTALAVWTGQSSP